jgi:hypothetical protein
MRSESVVDKEQPVLEVIPRPHRQEVFARCNEALEYVLTWLSNECHEGVVHAFTLTLLE